MLLQIASKRRPRYSSTCSNILDNNTINWLPRARPSAGLVARDNAKTTASRLIRLLFMLLENNKL